MKTTILILFFSFQVCHFSIAQNPVSSKEDFLKMANYLSGTSGKWATPNPNYDFKEKSSSEAFGLWFALELEQNLLHLTHVIYRGDTAHVTGESYWLWHPGEQRIKYYSVNIRGGFTDGETYFTSENVFVTTEYSYALDGNIRIRKDENFIISTNEHKTNSYTFKDSEWISEGNYTFNKTKEMAHYKVIKNY